jgi:hypothetical protein
VEVQGDSAERRVVGVWKRVDDGVKGVTADSFIIVL